MDSIQVVTADIYIYILLLIFLVSTRINGERRLRFSLDRARTDLGTSESDSDVEDCMVIPSPLELSLVDLNLTSGSD